MSSDVRNQGGQVYRSWQDARHTVTALEERVSPPSWKPRARAYVPIFLAYFLLTFLGVRLLLGTNGALLFWPAIGFAIGFLLLLDRSHWVRYLAGIAAVNFLANLTGENPLAACLMFAMTNVVDTLVPVLLYRRLVGGQEWRLQSVRSVIMFTLGAAVASPAVTGLLGTAVSVWVFGSADPARTWFIWWVTAMTGTVVVAPLVVAWAGWRPHETGFGRVREIGRAILTFGFFAVLLEFLLGSHLPVSLPVFSRTYLAFPLLFLWAYRYGMRGCTSAMVPITAVMLWNVLDGPWSFEVPGAAFPRPVTIQLYIAVLAMSGMLFAAMLSERSVILDRLRVHAGRVRDVARRLEVQVDRLPLGLIMLDRGAVVREWNPAAETIFGWTAREMTGHGLVDRIVPFDRRERFRRYLEEAEKTDRSISAVIPAVRKGGAGIHAEWHLTPLRDEQGVLQGMLATARDVTERDRADGKIHRLNRLYAFLSQINQAIVHARAHADLFRDVCTIALEFGKFRFAWIAEIDPVSGRLTPLVSAGHAGAYLDLMGAADLSRPEVRRTPVVASILSQEIQVVQDLASDPRIELWREEGLKYGFASYASLPVRVPGVFDGNLNVYAAEPDFFDTEELALLEELRSDIAFAIENLDREARRAAMEQALQEERALLAQRVEERTAELSQANEALGRAARLKDEFLASMSHELRTPLTGILGMAEALQMQVYGTLNDRQLRSVRTIEESGKHLLSLINDILDLSKVEAGKLELQPDTVVVRDICESAVVMVRQLAHRKNLKVTLTIDDAVRTLRADPRRLKQILVNLLSNAVKFTPEGGSVSLEVHGDAAHSRMRFLCRDTGIGIHQADFPKLFQPFVQLDSSLARQFSGTGLGLSLVHRMVELHGGSVDVGSVPGQGSVFTVTLPWEQAPDPGVQRAAKAPARGTAPEDQPESDGPHVLIVEDNETTLSLFTDFFRDSGYTVTAARNGAEAIQMFDTCTPAVVIMDVQMPGIDGLAAIRTIRDAERRSGRARVPVVALTALTMPGDRERCLEAGADVYLAKPVHLTTLADTVQDILRRKG